MNMKLVFDFETLDELAEFIREQKDFTDWKIKKQFKKATTTDNRGSHQKEYHALAKLYQQSYPSVSYKQCLKEAIKQAKENALKKE